jgi:hypothetical protein
MKIHSHSETLLYVASADEIVSKVPKNIFLFLKTTNTSVECLIERVVREYFDYKIIIYFDPLIDYNNLESIKIKLLENAYNNIIIKENKFIFEDFLKTNFTLHSKLSHKIVTHIKKLLPINSKNSNHLIDKQLVPLIDFWMNGGYYFSVNTTFENLKQTVNINELFNFICDDIIINKENQIHKNCKINFIKVHQFDCIVELAIKNYLLYYEKSKTYNFNRMFMNLYNNQNKMLSKNNKISQNPYLTCFKNKLKLSKKHANSIEYLFKFTQDLAVTFNATSENICPIINSNLNPHQSAV